MGTENKQKNLTAAYNVLCQYKNPKTPHTENALPGAATFVQHDNKDRNIIPGNYGQSFADTHDTSVKKCGTIWETARPPHLVHVWVHNHYIWESPQLK